MRKELNFKGDPVVVVLGGGGWGGGMMVENLFCVE